jgi:hypothetical protein
MVVSILLAAFIQSGCSAFTTYAPTADQNLPMKLGRTQQFEKDGVTVTVAVPTDDKASQFFGVPLAEHDIQLIWIRVDNESNVDYWLMPFAIDPDYYSADEAARMTGARIPVEKRGNNKALFRANALPFFFPAQTSQDGYIFASHKRGGRFIDLRLSGHLKAVRMRFAVLLPTESFDYEKSALRQIYAKVNELPDLDIAELRQRLQTLPCCATNEAGEGYGDPLNVVLIGSGEQVVSALTSSGWDFTEAITIDSIRRMIGAAIEEKAFPTAPVSSLYAFGRPQDLAMQRGRSTISQRNHMRLWLAPFRSQGVPVWIGQVSRDIGVKLTTRSSTLTTHVIDPLVDESREYLFHSLLYQDAVSQFAFVQGVGESSEENPRLNLTADPYFTDGMRMVLWLTHEPVPPHLAIDLGWNESADPAREGRGGTYMVPALTVP